ncbi:hypothetical protein Q3A80_24570 [Burkholderia sp. SR8]|jgi:hypothetical protein|uniref:hypothetical protein n=1 Tax=Burkholderia sp. SR8 TaxID=3062277 RepID=UPI004063EF00
MLFCTMSREHGRPPRIAHAARDGTNDATSGGVPRNRVGMVNGALRERAARRPGAGRRRDADVRVAVAVIASDNSDAVHNRSKMASS